MLVSYCGFDFIEIKIIFSYAWNRTLERILHPIFEVKKWDIYKWKEDR